MFDMTSLMRRPTYWCRLMLMVLAAISLSDPTFAQAPAATPAQDMSVPGAAPTLVPAAPATEPQVATPPAPTVSVQLPRDLTPWGMFRGADIIVKMVMIGLTFASVLTWTIWFAKTIELTIARRQLRASIAVIADVRSLEECVSRLSKERSGASALVHAAAAEIRLSAALDPTGVKERIASRLERLESAAGRSMIRGTGLLATIGATAPFVGLFGTVWGIMNSFIGISKQHTTNLAVVAPGIAEALLATALGLVAAIPAVVTYNIFSRWTASYRALHADAAAEVMRLVSRDLDRGLSDQHAPERRQPSAAV